MKTQVKTMMAKLSLLALSVMICENVTMAACQASFTCSVNNGVLTVVSTSTGTLGSTGYNWNFGDGWSGSGQNATHTYNLTGTYNVCLTISDSANSCNSSYCQSVTIAGTKGCSASFLLWQDSTNTKLYYALSTVGGTSPFSYTWNWGDGSTSNTAFPTHTYASSGTYQICLDITDNNGCQSQYCSNIVVSMTGAGDNGPMEGSLSSGTTVVVLNPAGIGTITAKDVSAFGSFPNPFAGKTTLRYSLLSSTNVKLSVYDMTGKEVKVIVNGKEMEGLQNHELDGRLLPAGIYMVRLETSSGILTQRILLTASPAQE